MPTAARHGTADYVEKAADRCLEDQPRHVNLTGETGSASNLSDGHKGRQIPHPARTTTAETVSSLKQ